MAHPPSDSHSTHGLTRRGLIQGTALTALTGGALFAAANPAQASRLIIGPGLEEGVMPPTESRIITPMSPTEKLFGNIDGTPTMYIRDGTGVRKPASFRCTFGFYDELVRWVQRIRTLSASQGYPGLSFVTSAGAYVNKPGQHGLGTAFDVDEIAWTDGRISRMIGQDWRSGDSATRKRYYAIVATSRANFHWVLDHTYNAAHADHIHQDFGSMPPVLSTGSSSDVGSIQRILNEFQGAGLAEDDIWGPLTNGAFQTSRQRLGTTAGNPHTETASYRAWLDAVARKGFAGVGW